MKAHTARQILSDETGELARKISLARGGIATAERVTREARSLVTRLNKRERQRRKDNASSMG